MNLKKLGDERFLLLLGTLMIGMLLSFFGTAMLATSAYDAKLTRAAESKSIQINGTYYRLAPVQ
jgi:hypothetical protein